MECHFVELFLHFMNTFLLEQPAETVGNELEEWCICYTASLHFSFVGRSHLDCSVDVLQGVAIGLENGLDISLCSVMSDHLSIHKYTCNRTQNYLPIYIKLGTEDIH